MATFNMTREMADEYHRATDGGAHPPWTKEQRITMVQADLQAGRIKLPREDGAFMREYLGEWKDHADAMAYAATATRATVAHRCALCSEVIDCDMSLVESYVTACAAHHAVCPKRPIEVGDYVRWEYGPAGRFAMPTNWVEGEVTRIDRYVAVIRADRCGMGNRAGKINGFGIGTNCGSNIRRIPRPAAAPKVGDIIPLETSMRPVFPRGADRSKPCQNCMRSWGEHFGVACSPPRMEGYEMGQTCTPGCQCGAHAVPKYRPVVVDKAAMERAMRDEKLMQRLQDETEKRMRWIATGGTRVHTLEPAPSPALIDGLDRESCLARWMENRLAVEGGAAAPNTMTRMQRDVGRALWLERYGAQRGAELRARVAADVEAERNRVRVDIQDMD